MPSPQIVSYDAGKNNLDLELARGRILQGGSWKQQRTIILVPSASMISAKVALSHWNLMCPPNQLIHRMLCLGMEVGEAYTQAVQAILSHPQLSEWEYLLTIEHDNIPPVDGFLRLLADMEAHPEYHCIGGLYWTKGVAGVPQIWGDVKDPVFNCRPQLPQPGQIVECCATGMGFNLWRLPMFKDKNLRSPWFKTCASAQEGVGTQDLYFWNDARPKGYRCAIDCDIRVGHHDAGQDFTW